MNSADSPLTSLFRLGINIHHLNKKSEKLFGLSLVQSCLLKSLIDMPGTSAHDLAESVGIHPSTLTQTLRRLEKKGYVFWTVDPRDSRRKVISLTKSGRQALTKFNNQAGAWHMAFISIRRELTHVNQVLMEKTSSEIVTSHPRIQAKT